MWPSIGIDVNKNNDFHRKCSDLTIQRNCNSEKRGKYSVQYEYFIRSIEQKKNTLTTTTKITVIQSL